MKLENPFTLTDAERDVLKKLVPDLEEIPGMGVTEGGAFLSENDDEALWGLINRLKAL